MNAILERDGTGERTGHSAVQALHSLIRIIDGILDECVGCAHEGAQHHGCHLATQLIPPVRVLMDELRREHGDDPPLRLGIIALEQRLRDTPLAEAPASPTAA
jgi:hypothetical protein